MADTPVNYRSILLDDGKLAVNLALAEKKRLRPYKFVIGDAYNFTPTVDGQVPTGTQVYTGDPTLIQADVPDEDTSRFVITIPETAGGFNIGNIMLYVQTDDGTILPFIWFVSNVQYPKEIISTNSRIVITFIQKIVNANDVLVLTVQPPEYWSLPSYPTEVALPQPSQALFQSFIVQDSISAKRPVLAARRTLDGKYWGTPLFSRVDEPFFGTLDGGRAAEPPDQPYEGRWFWGGKLRMQPTDLLFNYGGSKLGDNPILTNYGGEPLPDNPEYSDWGSYLTGEFIWGGRLEFPQAYYLSNFGGMTLTQTPENTFGGIPLPK